MPLTRRKFVQALGTGALAATANPTQVSAQKSNSVSGRSGKSKKAIVLAVDAMDPKMTGYFLDDMPALKRIAEEGFSGSILPYNSTWGNMNFMSMITGTAPGTHYRAEYPDGSSPVTPRCTAESLWQTLGKHSRKSLLVTFPQGTPSGSPNAAAVACSNAYLFSGVVHQTENIQDGFVDRTGHESSGWPPGGGPRVGRLSRFVRRPSETAIQLKGIRSKLPPLQSTISLTFDQQNNWLAVITAKGSRYDTLLLYSNSKEPPVAELRASEWSDWITSSFSVRGGTSKGHIRFKLLSVSSDGSGFQLLQSACCPDTGSAEPANLGSQLLTELGPYSAISSIGMYPHDPNWKVGVEESREREMWVARSAELGLKAWDWDLFLTEQSLIDNAKHQCAMPVDPDYHSYDRREAKLYEDVLRAAHIAADETFARYLDLCERNGIHLIIVGDHGMGLNNVICDIDKRLENTELQVRKSSGEIDWSKTAAYTKRTRQGSEVCVNLQGREEQGSVDPKDYEAVQDKIIDALIDWRDPDSGKRAVTYALKRRDAPVLGYFGSAFGDVVFAYNAGFSWGILPDGSDIGLSIATGTNHGAQVPSAETAFNSNLGILYAWGPGIKPGKRDEEMKGPIPIDEIAPTLAHLLDCPVPKDCTAAPIREVLGET